MIFEAIAPGSAGRIAISDTGTAEELFGAPIHDLRERIKSVGAIVFDGFDASVEDYERFTDLFGVPQAGVPGDGADTLSVRREVYKGRAALSAHAEDTYLPWPPHLLWFYCFRPATKSGRTMLWDGVEFLARLSSQTRNRFESTRLLFTQFFSRPAWQKRFGTTEEQVRQKYGGQGMGFEFGRGGTLKTSFATSAVRPTRWGNKKTFLNTILHALDDPDFYGLTFEDGEEIGADIERELRQIAAGLGVGIRWQSRSFAVVDNTRWMHGRESYSDTQRRIVARHQMVGF